MKFVKRRIQIIVEILLTVLLMVTMIPMMSLFAKKETMATIIGRKQRLASVFDKNAAFAEKIEQED